MGRNAIPVDLLDNKKDHYSSGELARRKSSEVKINIHNFVACPEVVADRRAYKEFRRLKRLYKEIEFIGSLDEHLINQYCLSVSELDDILMILNTARDWMRSDDATQKQLGINKFMEIDVEVRQKRSEIIKLSDRMYLNPVSRTKNLPKKAEEPKDDLGAKFGV